MVQAQETQGNQEKTTAVDLNDLTVWDLEVHTYEPYPILVEYIEDEQIRETEKSGYPSKKQSGPIPPDGWDRSAGGRIQHDLSGIQNAEDYNGAMEQFGIDKVAFSPGTGFKICQIPDVDLRIAYMRAMNRSTADRFCRDDDTFYGNILIVPEHPEESAEEIERHADNENMVAAFCADTGMAYPLGHKRYEPIYEALERNNLPLFMHGESTLLPWFPTQGMNFSKFMEVHTLCHPLAKMWHATSLIGQGVVERYDVNFCFLESGQSWFQFLRNRIDREYVERPNDAPELTKLPSEYMSEHFFLGTQPLEEWPGGEEHFQTFLEINDLEDRLVYTSDYPHMDFDATTSISAHNGLTAEQKKKIFQDNPEALLRL